MSTDDGIAYLVIEPNGNITFHKGPLTTLDAHDIVGGNIDILPQPRDLDITLIANEDGHRLGLDANWHATRLIRNMLRPSDFVTGKVIVTGLPGPDGDLRSITKEVEADVRRLAAEV